MIFGGKGKKYYREFWALKKIDFEISPGETVGIIGRNGSGKSTLLQIICGTLNPSEGSYFAKGKIAALLELGSGFNPEFTGRENIYMAGALYGMSVEQINAKYEEIKKFADIGSFIDQPVKTYSSGMYVRLAFAVIAHVDADILVIDEALAVGDAVFTQKCMRFIRKFKESGTLLFVSHDISSVKNLCDKSIWLDGGEVREIGETKQVADSYLEYTLQEVYGSKVNFSSHNKGDGAPGIIKKIKTNDALAVDYKSKYISSVSLNESNGWKTGMGEIYSVVFYDESSRKNEVFEGGEEVTLVIQANLFKPFKNPIIGFLLKDKLGQELFGENTLVVSPGIISEQLTVNPVEGRFTFKLPMLPNGEYSIMVSLAEGTLQEHIQHHWIHDAVIMSVNSSIVRWGLVGINFKNVEIREIQNEL
jgi:lipopolysaccharide transport system ATP-binding protein